MRGILHSFSSFGYFTSKSKLSSVLQAKYMQVSLGSLWSQHLKKSDPVRCKIMPNSVPEKICQEQYMQSSRFCMVSMVTNGRPVRVTLDRPQSLFDSYLKNFTAKLDWLGHINLVSEVKDQREVKEGRDKAGLRSDQFQRTKYHLKNKCNISFFLPEFWAQYFYFILTK